MSPECKCRRVGPPPPYELSHLTTIAKSTYVDKWILNDQMNHKLSNHSWKAQGISDVQMTQTLKIRYAQYVGNHKENLFWPTAHPNPNCTMCPNNAINTWPHLLSTCPNKHINCLCIAHHNNPHISNQTNTKESSPLLMHETKPPCPKT